MRTRTRRFGLILGALLVVAALAPCVALADVVPTPNQGQPLPQTTQTVTTTQGPGAAYWAARAARGSSQEQNALWYLLESMVFIGPLLLTLLIEVPVILIAGKGVKGTFKVAVLVNTLTNPIAVGTVLLLAVPALTSPMKIMPFVLVGAVELAVVAVEWRIFRWVLGWSNRRALIIALIANALSFGIGLAITAAWIGH